MMVNRMKIDFNVLWDDVCKSWKDDVAKEYKVTIINELIESNHTIEKDMLCILNECERFNHKLTEIEGAFNEFLIRERGASYE